MLSSVQYIIVLLALARLASSQISGIDAVATAPDKNGHPQCAIGNFTSTALGVANFSSPKVSGSSPLTWTVAISDTPDSFNQSRLLYDRNYIFGTPPSIDLGKSTSLYGCGLFFEGLTPLLSFSGANNETSTGKCTDALPANCVSDIIKLAQTEGGKLQQSQGNNNSSIICTTLQQRISSSPPESCNTAPKSAWEIVLARDLTGPSAAPALKENGCHPTTGKAYVVSLVASYRRVSAPDFNLIEPFESGVTPVMTALFDLKSNSTAPDVQLTCLKPLTSNAGETNDTGTPAHKSSAVVNDISRAGLLLGLLGFISVLSPLFL